MKPEAGKMTELTALLARVEVASGPDRELDFDLDVALDGLFHKLARNAIKQFRDANKRLPFDEIGMRELPAYTASIDAALALVEKVLPGWAWSIEKFPTLRAQLAQPITTEFGPAIGIRAQVTGATPPLAILAALLRGKPSGGTG